MAGRIEARITIPTGGWTVDINDSGGAAAVPATVPAGTYYLTSPDVVGGGTKGLLEALADELNTAAPTDTIAVSISAGEGGTGKVTITSTGSTLIEWDDVELRDLLGFDADASGTTMTGANQAQALWLPDGPYDAPNTLDGSWWGEPESDFVGSSNAAGYVWGYAGQSREVLERLVWGAVSRNKAIQANETTENESWERFAKQGIWGQAAWGTPTGPIRIHPDADEDLIYATYAVPELRAVKLAHFSDGFAAGSRKIPMPFLVRVPGTENEGIWALPEDAAEWVTTFPGITVPTHIWPMQDAAFPLVDTVGSVDLSDSAYTENVRNTGDPLGRYSASLEAVQAHVRAASTASLDITTGDFSIFFRFNVRAAENPASGHYFFRKKSSSATTNGWGVKFANTSGHISLLFDTASAADATATIAVDHDDGGWHYCLAVVDRTNGVIRIYTDLGSASASISAHAGGSATNGTYFGAGDVNGNLNSGAQAEYSYAAAWIGEALDSNDFARLSNA